MIRKCQRCEIVWTNKSGTDRIDPTRVPAQVCPDCATFDFPLYTERVAQAAKSLGKPNKESKVK